MDIDEAQNESEMENESESIDHSYISEVNETEDDEWDDYAVTEFKVVDEEGDPIQGASVNIPDLTTRETDAQGETMIMLPEDDDQVAVYADADGYLDMNGAVTPGGEITIYLKRLKRITHMDCFVRIGSNGNLRDK